MNASGVAAAAPAGSPPPGRTDWARLRAMSDADAEARAVADPDNAPASDAWLAAARLVPPAGTTPAT